MKIEGKVSVIIFNNPDTGYTVIKLKNKGEYTTCVGSTFDLKLGDEIELEGIEDTHITYGTQFKFSTYTKVLPVDDSNLITYIADNIKGIGKKKAKNIVDTFHDKTIDVIKYEKEKLKEIKGLDEDKINDIHIFFIEEYEKWNAIKYLSTFNISVNMGSKIYSILKEDTISTIKNNPYNLLEYVKNIDFKIIDEIGLKQGITLDNEFRINAGIIYSMTKVTDFGHTCIEEDTIVNYASKLLQVDKDSILNSIVNLSINEKLHISNINNIAYYIAEKNIAENIYFHTKQSNKKYEYLKEIEKVSKKNNLILSNEQKEAIKTCLNNSISIITGGPGTGKTTIIKCIIDILEDKKSSYVLTAPTGRAAKRMSETTKKQAKTIHRLLEIQKINDNDIDTFLNYPVKEVESDVIIIDEVSMIDTLMMNNLLKAIESKTKIIFVGDIDQLPSVGPGSVLKDIINSNLVATVFLKEIYRQSRESDIVVNAHKINDGIYPEFKNNNTDLFFIKTSSIDETIEEIKSLISFRLEKFANIDILKDLQVIAPMRKTKLGITNLNNIIQNILNPVNNKLNEVEHNSIIFRENDKVIQVMNNYDIEYIQNGISLKGVFNGDIGYISKINKEEKYVEVIQDDEKQVKYTFDNLDNIELCYATTVHKSQGSEYDYVILPLFTGYEKLLTRNLLYTAMTRAKKMLIILGSREIINFMVENKHEEKRKTGLLFELLNKVKLI
ncbi:MAG: ATP-dependent RecD-like DNA helicase [Clostridia bacterium]